MSAQVIVSAASGAPPPTTAQRTQPVRSRAEEVEPDQAQLRSRQQAVHNWQYTWLRPTISEVHEEYMKQFGNNAAQEDDESEVDSDADEPNDEENDEI